MLCIGFCNSGKTYSIQYTIKTTKCFDFIIIISNTAEFTGDYAFLKDLGIGYRIYSASAINEVMKYVMDVQKKNLLEGNKINVAIIFDDVMGSLTNNKTFQVLASCFRHYLISIIISTQYCNTQTTYIRELANYVYCFNQRTERAKKSVYESFFGDIGHFNDFKRIMNNLEPYQFFFVDRILKKRIIMRCPSAENKKAEPKETKEDFIKNFR